MKEKVGHTPGPWKMRRLPIDPCNETECFRIEGKGPTLFLHVTPCADGFIEGQNEANARLIAAAPCLLEACKEYERALMMCDKDALKHARSLGADAIAKAEAKS